MFDLLHYVKLLLYSYNFVFIFSFLFQFFHNTDDGNVLISRECKPASRQNQYAVLCVEQSIVLTVHSS